MSATFNAQSNGAPSATPHASVQTHPTNAPIIAGGASQTAQPPLNFVGVLRAMLAVSDKVSDLIFSPGRAPQIELVGKLQQVPVPGLEKMTPAHTAAIAKLIIGNQQSAHESLEK